MTISHILGRIAALLVQPASAHCDTEDGPVVAAGRRALGTGDLNHALPWVPEAAEAETRAAFEAARTAPGTGRTAPDSGRPALERRFLETLVRLHREAEGADYTGIKPSGTPLPPVVTAADEALEQGTMAPLEGLVDADHWAELAARFQAALASRDFDVDDVKAGRTFVAAYVSYVHYAGHAATGAVHSA